MRLSEVLVSSAKADLTLQDANKNTALHLACSKVRNTLYFLMYGAFAIENCSAALVLLSFIFRVCGILSEVETDMTDCLLSVDPCFVMLIWQ